MKKSKFIKKVFSILIAMIFAFSPVLLTGCFPFSDANSNTQTNNNTQQHQSGGSSGGGGGSLPNTNNNQQNQSDDEEEYDESEMLKKANQYLDNYLVTYKTVVNSDGLENAFEQVSIYAISKLYEKFGFAVDNIPDDSTLDIAISNTKNGNVEFSTKSKKLNSIFGSSITFEEGDENQGKIVELSDYFKYSVDAEWLALHQQYLDDNNSTALETLHLEILNNYMNDLKVRKSFELALFMIAADVDLYQYISKVSIIQNGTLTEDKAHQVFLQYFSNIDKFEFTDEQKVKLNDFFSVYVLNGVSADLSLLCDEICEMLKKVTNYSYLSNNYVFVGGENEGMNGQQTYQSIVFMPKSAVNISQLDLFLSTEIPEGVTIHMYLRYYDKNNGFVNFGTTLLNPTLDPTLYDLGRIDIAYFVYEDEADQNADFSVDNSGIDDYGDGTEENYDEDDQGSTIYSQLHNDQGIDIQAIIKSAGLDGKLPEFTPLDEFEKNTSSVAVSGFDAGIYFDTIDVAGKSVVVFSQEQLPPEERQSYFELIFVTDNANDTFRVSINIEDEDFGE